MSSYNVFQNVDSHETIQDSLPYRGSPTSPGIPQEVSHKSTNSTRGVPQVSEFHKGCPTTPKTLQEARRRRRDATSLAAPAVARARGSAGELPDPARRLLRRAVPAGARVAVLIRLACRVVAARLGTALLGNRGGLRTGACRSAVDSCRSAVDSCRQ